MKPFYLGLAVWMFLIGLIGLAVYIRDGNGYLLVAITILDTITAINFAAAVDDKKTSP